MQDAAGHNVCVIATAAQVCRDLSANALGSDGIDTYAGTKLRVPDKATVLEDSNSAPVLATYVPHADAHRGALQVGSCPHPFQGLQSWPGLRRSTSCDI